MRPCKGYNSELIGTVRFTSLSPQRETPSHQQPPPPAQAAPRPHAVATDLPVLDARVRGIAWRVAFCAGLFHAARRFRAHPCCDACSASFFPWPNTGPVTGFPAAAHPFTIGDGRLLLRAVASPFLRGGVFISREVEFTSSFGGLTFALRGAASLLAHAVPFPRPPPVRGDPNSSTSSPPLASFFLIRFAPVGVRLVVVSTCICLVTNDAEHLLMCLLAITS